MLKADAISWHDGVMVSSRQEELIYYYYEGVSDSHILVQWYNISSFR